MLEKRLRKLGILGIISLLSYTAMLIGSIGTSLLPGAVFGLFERFSTFSAVVFNGVLGIYLMKGSFEAKEC